MKYTYFATVYLPNKKALRICKISFQNLHRQAIKKFRNFHSFKTHKKKKKKKKKKRAKVWEMKTKDREKQKNKQKTDNWYKS